MSKQWGLGLNDMSKIEAIAAQAERASSDEEAIELISQATNDPEVFHFASLLAVKPVKQVGSAPS